MFEKQAATYPNRFGSQPFKAATPLRPAFGSQPPTPLPTPGSQRCNPMRSQKAEGAVFLRLQALQPTDTLNQIKSIVYPLESALEDDVKVHMGPSNHHLYYGVNMCELC